MTQDGIVFRNATNGLMKEMIIAKTAVQKIVRVDALRVIATQAMDSPYVVFGHPPKIAPKNEPTPSPNNVRFNPGSFRRSGSGPDAETLLLIIH